MSELIERLSARHAQDEASGFIARNAAELPLSFAAIQTGWLTDVLCRGVAGAEVTGFALGEDDDGSSNRRRIAVSYNQAGRAAGLPALLFCKATHGLRNRLTLGLAGAITTEIQFYRHIRALLPIEAPVCHYAHYDPDSFNSMIMLDDLGPRVQEFCSHTTMISRARAESQMRLLGTLHGLGYADARVRQAAAPLDNWQDFFNRTKLFGLDAGAKQGFLDAEAVIPPALFKHAARIWEATERSTALAAARPPTLAHGDVHLKNWYVAASGAMGLADWQCATRGHWGRDLAYTISTALTVADRRNWERDLIELYLDTMAGAGGPRIPLAQGWDIYREQLFGALAWWTVTLSPPPGMPDMQPRDTTLEFIRRIATAMDDLDAFKIVMVNQ